MKNVSMILPYIIGGITFFVCFLLALYSAGKINYKSDHSDKKTRRIWFWVLAVLTPVLTFLICYFGWATNIQVPSKADEFTNHTCYSTAAFFVLFIILGFIISKIFKTKKVQSWF